MKKVVSTVIFLALLIAAVSSLAEVSTAPKFNYTVLKNYDNYSYDKFEESWSYYGAFLREFSDANFMSEYKSVETRNIYRGHR